MATAGIIKEVCKQLSLFCDDDPAAGPPYRGGAYGRILTKGREAHHMPAKTVNGVSEYSGPAIQMDAADHWHTTSWGPGRRAKEFRAQEEALIQAGNTQAAMDMEIDDIRSKFGDKYDGAINEMLDYARRIGYIK